MNSDSITMSSWTISKDDPILANRRGGERAHEGYEFQRAYGICRLLDLLENMDGLERLRWEGAEDIDLCYPEYCNYIQVKHGKVDKTILLEILRRFYDVWVGARNNNHFCLVYLNVKGVKFPAKWPPKYVTKSFPPDFLANVQLKAVPDTNQLLNDARARLAKRGIPSNQLDLALGQLVKLLSGEMPEVLSTHVRESLSKFRQDQSIEEIALQLSLRCLERMTIRKRLVDPLQRYVQRPDLSNMVDAFLRSERRLLIIKGLPGSGKTTVLLEAVKNQRFHFFTSLAAHERLQSWAGMFDKIIKTEFASSYTSFLAFCHDLAVQFNENTISIVLDDVEHAINPIESIWQILADLSAMPANVKVLAAIRWADFPTAVETQFLDRSDIAVANIPVLQDEVLTTFLSTYDLPTDLPLAAYRILKTPFAVRVLSSLSRGNCAFVHLGTLIKEYFAESVKSSAAKALLLKAIGKAAFMRNSFDAIPIEDIRVAADTGKGSSLSATECDSDSPFLRHFIEQGIFIEYENGIRATHDLWIELLVARTLHSMFNEKGLTAVIDSLLEVDYGVRWSALFLMPGIFTESQLRMLADGLVAVVDQHLTNLTEEEWEAEWRRILLIRQMVLGDSEPAPVEFQHLLNRRAAINHPALMKVSRSAEVLAVLFSTAPNEIGPSIELTGDRTRSWLVESLQLRVVIDPYLTGLINSNNLPAVHFMLRLVEVLILRSLGIQVGIFNGESKLHNTKPVSIKAYEGTRLPTVYERRKMNAFHLINPCAFDYLVEIMPSLIALAGEEVGDNYVVGYLERFADVVSVAIEMHGDANAAWTRLLSRVPAESLFICAWIFSSTYPHVLPVTLLRASFDRIQKEPSAFEQIRKFNNVVVGRAMEFLLLDLDKAPTEKLLFQLAHAIDTWRLDITLDGTKLLEEHICKLQTDSERLAARCLIFLAFHAQLDASSDIQQIDQKFISDEVEAVKTLLVSSMEQSYSGFHTTNDPSRIPLDLAEWLRKAGRTKEAIEMELIGTILVQVCDRIFGIPT